MRMADVMIVESFEVRILVVATYFTQFYYVKTPESLHAKITVAERYFHTCLTCVDTSHFCNISEPGDGRRRSAVHPTHERYSHTHSGPAPISRNDGVTDSAVNPGSIQYKVD